MLLLSLVLLWADALPGRRAAAAATADPLRARLRKLLLVLVTPFAPFLDYAKGVP